MPQIRGDSLMVEIMTPHQGHYYQSSPAADSISPHDSGQPNPISFLTVPPGSGFTFHVVCDRAHLDRIAPELAQDSRWQHLLTAAFEHAFSWCGFGAKTAVGYGAMARDFAAETQAEAARAKHEAEAKLAALTPNLRAVEQFSQAMASRYEQLRGSKERQNTEYHQKAQKLAKDAREGTDWTQAEKRAAAEAITEWLPKVVERIDRDALKKLKLNDLRGTP
jgi:CRISPR-associated protein Cmr6